ALPISSTKTMSQGDEARFFVNSGVIGQMATMMAPMDNLEKVLSYFLPGTISMGMKFDGAVVRTSTFFSRPAGGMKVLDLVPSEQIKVDSLSIVPKDAMMAGLWAIEGEKVWPFIKEFANTIEPGAAEQLDQQVAGMKDMIGVDLKADLLDQLNGEFLYYASAPKGPLPIPGLVMALGVKDPSKAKKTLNTLIELAGDEVSVRGVSYKENTFYTITVESAGMMPVQPAYAFTDKHLWIALNTQDIKIAMSRAAGDTQSSLLDSDAFKKAKGNAGLPGSFTSVNFIDMATVGSIAYNSLLQGLQMLSVSGMADQLPIDFALLPSSEAITQHLFPSLSYTICDQEGVQMKSASPIGDEMLMVGGLLGVAPAFFLGAARSRQVYESEAVDFEEAEPALSKGSMAPEWSLETPAGDKVSLSSQRGTVIVMDFWATWCPPCREAMPSIQKVHEKFKGKNVKFYGISTWETGDPAKFMKDNGYTYNLLLNGDDAAAAYNVSGIPALFVVNKDGQLELVETGFSAEAREEFENRLSKAIESAMN
ncbi:MAG: redoxin domain-containing protein, partial [Planctomycetota bacterium]